MNYLMNFKRSMAITLLALLFMNACDNVINRAKPAVYRGSDFHSVKSDGKGVDVCPQANLFTGTSKRLLTEQRLELKADEQVVLEQVIPNVGDTVFLDIFLREYPASKESIDSIICLIDENNLAIKISPELITKKTSEQDGGEQWQLSGVKNKRLLLTILNEGSKKPLLLRLDMKLSEHEGLARQPEDKTSMQDPVSGFVDLHLHQTGAMAFNQGWYWGSHEPGSLEERLADCDGEHASMFEHEWVLDHPVTGPIAYAIAPKHDTDDFMRSHLAVTKAKDYVRSDDRKHQQVAFERLREAHERGLNLIISTVVENNILLDIMYGTKKGRSEWYPSVMESIKRQIHSLHQIDEQSEWFEIVYDPWEARRVINEGKLAVVIGAEFTDIFPPSDGPWEQQLYDLYEMGVRHLQPVHKSDSQFSSTHQQGFPFDNLNLLRALIRKEIPDLPAIKRTFGQDDPDIGLSPEGYRLLDALVNLNMIVDLSHASLSGQKDMTNYLVEKKQFYPFIYSHWSARSPELLDQLKLSGGMIAFGWGQPVPEIQEAINIPEDLNCQDFVKNRAQLYQRYLDYGVNFSLASDMNGFTSTTQPSFGPKYCELDESVFDRTDQTATWEKLKNIYPEQEDWINRYWAQGTADISLFPGIIYDLREVLKMDTSKLDHSVEDFIQMWERTYDSNRGAVQ